MLNLGDVTQRSGELQVSESWYKQSLAVAERINDRERICWANIALATVQKDLGDLDEAAQSIRRAFTTARAIKSTRCLHYAQVVLADLRITQAVALPEQTQYIQNEQTVLAITRRTDQHKNRTLLLRRAYILLQRANTMTGVEIETVIEGQHQLALAQYLLHDNESAYQTACHALQDALAHETRQIIGRVYLLLGRIQAARGVQQDAEEYFQQAITICQQHGLRLDYARTLHHYGCYLLQRTLTQEGISKLQEAQCIFEQSHAELDLLHNTQAQQAFQHSGHSQFIPTN
jgi:tetratricopeptide (TPR) repeat protein